MRRNKLLCLMIKAYIQFVDKQSPIVNNTLNEFKIVKTIKCRLAEYLWNVIYKEKRKFEVTDSDGIKRKVSGDEYIDIMKKIGKQKGDWFGYKGCREKAAYIEAGVT